MCVSCFVGWWGVGMEGCEARERRMEGGREGSKAFVWGHTKEHQRTMRRRERSIIKATFESFGKHDEGLATNNERPTNGPEAKRNEPRNPQKERTQYSRGTRLIRRALLSFFYLRADRVESLGRRSVFGLWNPRQLAPRSTRLIAGTNQNTKT